MRVFAGPNGSGKSTTIDAVRKHREKGRPIDFGVYVNADDIAKELFANKSFDFRPFGIKADPIRFREFAVGSGLLRAGFTKGVLLREHRFHGDQAFILRRKRLAEPFAQLIAQYLYEELISAKKKFSFETVFSHPSKLLIMQKAAEAEYKVYLYFVCTESAQTNVERVALRVKKGGHAVPKAKIIDRYKRTLDLLQAAVHESYHAFFWDNTGAESVLFAEMKRQGPMEPPRWAWENHEKIPYWFIENFLLRYEPGHELYEFGIDLLEERLPL